MIVTSPFSFPVAILIFCFSNFSLICAKLYHARYKSNICFTTSACSYTISNSPFTNRYPINALYFVKMPHSKLLVNIYYIFSLLFLSSSCGTAHTSVIYDYSKNPAYQFGKYIIYFSSIHLPQQFLKSYMSFSP